jgi:hypothetical protein
MAPLSTEDVAKKVGIGRVTLERWLATSRLRRPKMIRYGRNKFRDWTASDVKRVVKYKQENYRKGRGRKAQSRKQ